MDMGVMATMEAMEAKVTTTMLDKAVATTMVAEMVMAITEDKGTNRISISNPTGSTTNSGSFSSSRSKQCNNAAINVTAMPHIE